MGGAVIDGKTVAIVDGYAEAVPRGGAPPLRGLSGGRHTLTITPLGRKRLAAMGRWVAVDALAMGRACGGTPCRRLASWATKDEPAATDGEVAVSDVRAPLPASRSRARRSRSEPSAVRPRVG